MKKLIIIQDLLICDNSVNTKYYQDIIDCAQSLFEIEEYEFSNCILVFNNNEDYENANKYLNTIKCTKFEESIYIIEDNSYDMLNRQNSDDYLIYLAFDFINEDDTVAICRPSKCFKYNNNKLEIDANEIQVVFPDDLEDFENNLINGN